MRTLRTWLLTAALLAAAWLIAFVAPDGSRIDPFVVETAIGQRAEGRDLVVTVHDVRLADELAAADGWRADGPWLVVDLDVAAVRTQRGTTLDGATLVIGDRSFRASERMPSMMRHALVPGIPYRGALAFELPADALTGTARLRLSVDQDTRGDSLIELTIDLDALTSVALIGLPETDWATR